jgi:hydrogenase maturation protein HypF
VYHHHAHASTAYFEGCCNAADPGDMLVFTWDGVGLGPDGSLWGGEALLGRPGQWRKVAGFRPFKLPGGERAGREPWRSAAALCWEAGLDCPLAEASDPLLYSFWQQGKNAPLTTAAGRLFDAAAALSGVCRSASFEGQGPMQLEALAAQHDDPDRLPVTALALRKNDGVYCADWQALITLLGDHELAVTERAARFHLAMAHSLLEQALCVRGDTGVKHVGLAGGVFQNRLLTEKVIALLNASGFMVTLPRLVPVNDGGISFGQIIEYGYQGSD